MEGLPQALELGAKFAIVVDLAVKDKVKAAVRSRHWLAGRVGEINYCQSPMPQEHGRGQFCSWVCGRVRDPKFTEAFAIRSPMSHGADTASHLLTERFGASDLY